jgi:parallel beta-helix repeat protein
LLLFLLIFTSPCWAATFTVTTFSNADDSPGTLRRAILDANANPGKDTIAFNLSGMADGVFTVDIPNGMPTLNGPVVLDGRTQPGSGAKPNVAIRSSSLTPKTFMVAGTGAEIFHLGFVGFRFSFPFTTTDDIAGLTLGGEGNHLVDGCFIGVNPQTEQPRPNRNGIVIPTDSNKNRIQNSVISGNDRYGIVLMRSDENVIDNCRIGVDSAGERDISNRSGGIDIGELSDKNHVLNCVISRNTDAGISVEGNENRITNNLIGLESSGANLLKEDPRYFVRNSGVNVRGSSNIVGEIAGGNTIAGFANGIELGRFGQDPISGNVIQANRIGTDKEGLKALGNDSVGIILNDSFGVTFDAPVVDTLIGGSNPSEGNLVSANRFAGIQLNRTTTTNTRILGNTIGPDKNGNPFGKAIQYAGVQIRSAQETKIGGPGDNDGNLIAGNLGGVRLSKSTERITLALWRQSSSMPAIPMLSAYRSSVSQAISSDCAGPMAATGSRGISSASIRTDWSNPKSSKTNLQKDLGPQTVSALRTPPTTPLGTTSLA